MTAILQWLSDALSMIVDFFVSIFSLVMNIVEGLLNLLRNIPKFLSYLTQSIGFLPSFIAVFATATISLAVIYVILGRGGKSE